MIYALCWMAVVSLLALWPLAAWAMHAVAGLGPLVDSLLQAAPALAGGMTVVTWGVWAIGSVLLLQLGAGLHGLIAVWRRRGGNGSDPGAGASLAAG